MFTRILVKIKLMQQFSGTSDAIAVCALPSQIQAKAFSRAVNETLDDVLTTPEASSLVAEKKTRNLCKYYGTLIPNEKKEFLGTLSRDYGVDQSNVLALTNQLSVSQERGPAALLRTEERLRSALTPKYQTLFTHISHLENGVKFLVDLRADILQILTSQGADNAFLQAMSTNLRNLLSLWFSVGFLKLERITWESPCDMLQKISDYEAVHPIRNWTDLKRRVGPYRRCFVFTHNSMPREPVVVLHIALTNEISRSIQTIVNNKMFSTEDSQENVTNCQEESVNVSTAIFYSITSTQKGLQGVELGNYLIRNAVREIQTEFPAIHQFSSLSPIPGFKDWTIGEINKCLHRKDIGEEAEFLTLEELNSISSALSSVTEDTKPLAALKEVLSSGTWKKHEHICECLKPVLMKLCAKYLYIEKRRGYALNPVSNFHLRNGAVMWRLNWLADTSPRGLNASFGIMVNYRYFLDQTEQNSKQYTEDCIIHASDSILDLVKLNKLVPRQSLL